MNFTSLLTDVNTSSWQRWMPNCRLMQPKCWWLLIRVKQGLNRAVNLVRHHLTCAQNCHGELTAASRRASECQTATADQTDVSCTTSDIWKSHPIPTAQAPPAPQNSSMNSWAIICLVSFSPISNYKKRDNKINRWIMAVEPRRMKWRGSKYSKKLMPYKHQAKQAAAGDNSIQLSVLPVDLERESFRITAHEDF